MSLKDLHSKHFPDIPLTISLILSIIIISFITILLVTDFIDDLILNLFTEMIGIVVTIYVIENLISKKWYSVDYKIDMRIKKFLISIAINFFNTFTQLKDEEFKTVWHNTNSREKLKSIIPITNDSVNKLTLSRLDIFKVILKIEYENLLELNTKFLIRKPKPEIIEIFDDLEINMKSAIVTIENYYSNMKSKTEEERLKSPSKEVMPDIIANYLDKVINSLDKLYDYL